MAGGKGEKLSSVPKPPKDPALFPIASLGMVGPSLVSDTCQLGMPLHGENVLADY